MERRHTHHKKIYACACPHTCCSRNVSNDITWLSNNPARLLPKEYPDSKIKSPEINARTYLYNNSAFWLMPQQQGLPLIRNRLLALEPLTDYCFSSWTSTIRRNRYLQGQGGSFEKLFARDHPKMREILKNRASHGPASSPHIQHVEEKHVFLFVVVSPIDGKAVGV